MRTLGAKAHQIGEVELIFRCRWQPLTLDIELGAGEAGRGIAISHTLHRHHILAAWEQHEGSPLGIHQRIIRRHRSLGESAHPHEPAHAVWPAQFGYQDQCQNALLGGGGVGGLSGALPPTPPPGPTRPWTVI